MGVTVALGAWLIVAGAHPYLEDGERFYEAQAYEKAVARLTMAIGVPENSLADRRLAFELLARCHVALGRLDRAEEAFAQLLSRDPSAPAPKAAPKIRDAFTRAKQRLYAADYIKLHALAARTNEVRVELIDPWGLAKDVLLFEAAAAGAFVATPLKLEDGHYAGPIANSSQRYFVSAVDGNRNALASLGTSDAPMVLVVEAAPVASVIPTLIPTAVEGRPNVVAPAALPAPRSRTPVWIAGAASAVVLAAGVAVAIAASTDSQQAGQALFSSDRKSLDDSAREKALAANVLVGVAIVGGAGTVVLAWAW